MLLLSQNTIASGRAAAGRPAVVRRAILVRASAQQAGSTRRGVLAASLVAVGLTASGGAQARDYKEMLAKKEARRAKLKETASGIKSTGKDQQTFKSSEYEVSEEARTPNIHSRQNEGARTQENV